MTLTHNGTPMLCPISCVKCCVDIIVNATAKLKLQSQTHPINQAQ